MDVEAILALIPEELLSELALESGVDKYSKKLQGKVLFKLLIHSILSHKDNSLRTMESAYESIVFKLLNADADKGSIRYSSISTRLSTVKVNYFERLYDKCVAIYGNEIGERLSSITRFDSTIVCLSGKLLKTGYHFKSGAASHVRQLKFTIGFSELPTSAYLFTEQKYTSENAALKEAIIEHRPFKENAIRIFDRGVTSRKTHDELTKKKIPFVSRVSTKSKQSVYRDNTLKKPINTPTLNIYSDSWVHLFTTHSGKAKYPIRLIKTKSIVTGEEIDFVSNIPDITAFEITELYKRRWDIEVFFKFLKQELNFSHLLNRSQNGITVVLYATLIAAILLLVYKKKNHLNGYKIMKLRFVQEIERLITKDIVIMCDGSPILFDKYFGKPPS